MMSQYLVIKKDNVLMACRSRNTKLYQACRGATYDAKCFDPQKEFPRVISSLETEKKAAESQLKKYKIVLDHSKNIDDIVNALDIIEDLKETIEEYVVAKAEVEFMLAAYDDSEGEDNVWTWSIE